MASVKKGDWVQIENIVLPAGQRAPQVPEDTQACDLKLWVKGIAQQDAEMGDEIEIKTVTGRIAKGRVCDVNPRYVHDYGESQPELRKIYLQVKEI